MSNIGNDANNLDSALKRGQGSARSLAAEILGVDSKLVMTARHAGELGEALAKAAKAGEGLALGIGTAIAAITTAVALFVGWETKAREIADQIKNIRLETERFNALAQNDVRLAKEKEITLERDQAVQQLEKERGIMGKMGDTLDELKKKGGIIGELARMIVPKDGFHLYNYDDLRKAIDARADAERNEFVSGINRDFGRTGQDLQNQIQQADPALVFLDDQRRQLTLNRLAREDAIRKQQQQGEDKGFTPDQVTALVNGINVEFDQIAETIKATKIKSLGDQLGASFAESIANGISTGVQSGSLGKGFRALTGGILAGLGQMMVTIGKESLLAANIFNDLIQSFRDFAPAGAITASLALIAFGGLLEGLGGSLGGGGGAGGGGYGGGGYGSVGGGLPSIVTSGIVAASSGGPSGSPVKARAIQQNTFNIIGENDPRAGRQIQKILDNNAARG